MSGRLRAGVIGLGWAGQQHISAYAESPDVDLVALAGMEPDQLQVLGDAYGVALDHRYADWPALISGAELDVVSVATPTTLHHAVVIAALDAGLHVLSEKPIAENADRAQEMVEAAQRNNRVLDVSFNHRQRGDVRALKQLIDDGMLGTVYYAKTGWLRRAGIPGLGSWFTRKATAGGGPLMDIGVHMLDMALWLLGEPAVTSATASTFARFGPFGRGGSVEATMRKTGVTAGSFDVEDLATAFLRLGPDATLLLESSWAQWIPEDVAYVTVYGSAGGAALEWGGTQEEPWRTMRVWTEINGVAATLQPLIPPDGLHRACVRDFLAAVRGGDFGRHSGRDALTRARVVDACYDSAAQHREVALT